MFLLLVVWILDRRLFWYRIVISDEALVTAILIVGMFTMVKANDEDPGKRQTFPFLWRISELFFVLFFNNS